MDSTSRLCMSDQSQSHKDTRLWISPIFVLLLVSRLFPLLLNVEGFHTLVKHVLKLLLVPKSSICSLHLRSL